MCDQPEASTITPYKRKEVLLQNSSRGPAFWGVFDDRARDPLAGSGCA